MLPGLPRGTASTSSLVATIRGYRRRGFTPESIRNFCERIGVAKRNNVVDIANLEHAIREDLNLRRNEELGQIQERARKAIQDIARAEKFDLIVEQAVFVDPKSDITDRLKLLQDQVDDFIEKHRASTVALDAAPLRAGERQPQG